MIAGEFKLCARAQHAVGLNSPDHALAKRHVFCGNVGSRLCEHGLQPGARVGGAADDLNWRALAAIDHTDAQAVGVRVLIGLDHMRDHEVFQLFGGIVEAFNLKADARQRLDDLVERRVRFEMVLEPGEGEFHVSSFYALNPPAKLGRSRGRKP